MGGVSPDQKNINFFFRFEKFNTLWLAHSINAVITAFGPSDRRRAKFRRRECNQGS